LTLNFLKIKLEPQPNSLYWFVKLNKCMKWYERNESVSYSWLQLLLLHSEEEVEEDHDEYDDSDY
jgi:hypothetical protein